MNTIENLRSTIYENINNSHSQNEISENFNREHIFLSILKWNFFINENTKNKLDSIYLYQLFQKNLYQLKGGNKHTANALFEKASKSMEQITFTNTASKEGFNIIKYPFIAYFYYKDKKYDLAEDFIKRSLASIDYAIEKGFLEGLLAKLEQEYNLLKILVRKGQLTESYTKAYEIIKILHTNKIFLNIMEEEEYLSVYKHFINKVIIEIYSFGVEVKTDFFLKLSKLTSISYTPKDVKVFLSLFLEPSKEITNFNLSSIPFMFQYLLFIKHFKDDKLIFNYLSDFKEYERIKN